MALTYTLPADSVILVTGANGYIASHIVDVLLSQGYRVRGTVRNAKPWLNDLFAKKYGEGKFQTVVLPVIEGGKTLDAALDGVAGVVHAASDVSFSGDPNAVIPVVQKITVDILAAAAKHSSIKRFILTSSSSAAIIPTTNEKGVIVDENSWNDAAVTAAWDKNIPEADKGYLVYAASKTEGERAAWKWVAEHKPGFVFNAVLPNFNSGPILVPKKQSASTMGFIRKFFDGDYFGMTLSPQYYVDVRDCAKLHVAALLDASVSNERLFAFAHEFNWTDILAILHNLRPDKTLIDAPPNEGRDYTIIARQGRAEQLLKTFFGQSGWTGLEKSIAAGIADLA